MKLIYVAGKYRGDRPIDVKRNIRLADMAGEYIVEYTGHMPVIPHKNTEGYEGLQGDDFFLEGTLELMRRCDAVYLLPKWEESSGARGEEAEARRLGMPVFTSLPKLSDWLKDAEANSNIPTE